MKYVALLRGINVGGKNMIKMIDLRETFEECGFEQVSTFINSGNVLFSSSEDDVTILDKRISKALKKRFDYSATVVIRSEKEVKQVIDDMPNEWKKENNLRCYIAFIKDGVSPSEVIKELPVNEKVDSLQAGKTILYMSTKMDGLTSSGFTKIIGKKIFQSITIRNINTTKKLLALMV